MNAVRKRDIGLGLIGVSGSAVLLAESMGMTFPSKTFPVGVSACMIVLSLLVLGRAVFFPGTYEGKRAEAFASWQTLLMIAGAALYVSLITVLGFYTSSMLCIIFLSLLNAHEGVSARSLIKTILSGLIFLGLVYVIFSYSLQSTIPRGMLL